MKKPMLANIGTQYILTSKEYIFEPKLDGYRAIAKIDNTQTPNLNLFSRNGINITSTYPEIKIKTKTNEKTKTCILDGELVSYDEKGNPSFELLQNKQRAVYVVFDILEKNGKTLTDLPLIERKKILSQTIEENETTQINIFVEDGIKLWETIAKRDIEGVIAKKKDSKYYSRRTNNWLKIKNFKTIDCIILGFNQGKDSLNLGIYENSNIIDIGNVGTGFSQKDLIELKEKVNSANSKNLLVCEIKYLEFTKGKKLRAPVFLKLREDKTPQECKIEEILELEQNFEQNIEQKNELTKIKEKPDELGEYVKKRKFDKTPEPKAESNKINESREEKEPSDEKTQKEQKQKKAKENANLKTTNTTNTNTKETSSKYQDLKSKSQPINSQPLKFVIQRHDARRLHFDFRLEHDGVLKSWAIPKGLSTDVHDKRLAIEVEDHPFDYINFEGTIPQGNYGAGTVTIWDKGHYVNITVKNGKIIPLSQAIEKGHFIVWIKGEKIEAGYGFTRIDEKQWLAVRMRDEKKEDFPSEIEIDGKKIELTNQEKTLHADIKKGDFVQYYKKISKFMLPHIKERPISMYRFPSGIEKGFFQKEIPEYFPSWITTVKISHHSRDVNYVVCKTQADIIYLANQVCVIHITSNRKDKLEYPDKMIFDLDPSKKDLELLKKVAKIFKKFLEDIGFVPYIMTTGGKGYHVVVPIKPDSTHKEVRDFAGKLSQVIINSYPEFLTNELSIKKRKEKIFIDINRNSSNQTSVAPYSIRAKPSFPIAKPINWEDLDNSDPQTYTIRDKIKSDPWEDIFKNAVSINDVIKKLKNI